MVETLTEEKETKEKDKSGSKDLMKDILYAAVKGIGGFGLEAFADLKIEGKENVPIIGKAILTTVSDNAMRDMAIISQVSGRRIHFMVYHKLMKHQLYGPVLKSLGMFRSTLDKDDTIPIDKVFHYLNEAGDLVAMTPESKLTPEVQVKAMAGIIKFAVAAMAPIIPIAIYTEKAKILNLIDTTGIRVKIGTPLKVEKRLSRPKYRDERYELAADMIKIIDSLRVHLKQNKNKNEVKKMEKNKNSEMDDIENNFEGLTKELKKKKADLIKELNDTADFEVSMEPDKKMSEFIGDIFYKSMKGLFDTSAKLAKSLTNEIFTKTLDK